MRPSRRTIYSNLEKDTGGSWQPETCFEWPVGRAISSSNKILRAAPRGLEHPALLFRVNLTKQELHEKVGFAWASSSKSYTILV